MYISHKDFQKLLKTIGEALGYKAETEYQNGQQGGLIDVVWKKDNVFITFEIEDTVSNKKAVLLNFVKCLGVGTKHIHILKGRVLDLEKYNKKNVEIVSFLDSPRRDYDKFRYILFDKNEGKMENRIRLFCENVGCGRRTAFRLLKEWRKEQI